ncbi:STAS domain-containing protein [Cellulomonas sp.]|uniref:STAS domain-containing protein n=1 Tax=Cellulomonas sp. TaxID=40001 RepID=UPI002D28112B|nr:STAS domain-containing protein [Cellulomonas sp.]HYQ75290.1 STAS domain-containing protein [Cellulomonas sp.]
MPHRAGAITVGTDAGRTVVRLRGDVDASLRDEASRALAVALTDGAPVLLDLGEVAFIDSTGIAFLIQCRRACEQTGQACTLRDVPESTRYVLGLLGLDELVGG